MQLRAHWFCVKDDSSKPVPMLADCRETWSVDFRMRSCIGSPTSLFSAISTSVYRCILNWLGSASLRADHSQEVVGAGVRQAHQYYGNESSPERSCCFSGQDIVLMSDNFQGGIHQQTLGTVSRFLCQLTHEIFVWTGTHALNLSARYISRQTKHGDGSAQLPRSIDSNQVIASSLNVVRQTCDPEDFFSLALALAKRISELHSLSYKIRHSRD